MNPYVGTQFISFFRILYERCLGWHPGPLYSDEIQLLVCISIAISCSIVGTFLVLRQMTLLANALSHTILLGIVISLLIIPTAWYGQSMVLGIAALLMGGCTSWMTQACRTYLRVQEDASIGLVFSFAFAVAILLVSAFFRNSHVGLELILGNADALVLDDIWISSSLMTLNLVLLLYYFRGMVLTTFDPLMAKALGFSPAWYTALLMAQTSLTTVGAFRAVGVFMVLAFLVVPTLILRLFVHRLRPLLIGSALLSVVVVGLGVAISRTILTVWEIGVSTGGILVTILFLCFLIAWGLRVLVHSLRESHST